MCKYYYRKRSERSFLECLLPVLVFLMSQHCCQQKHKQTRSLFGFYQVKVLWDMLTGQPKGTCSNLRTNLRYCKSAHPWVPFSPFSCFAWTHAVHSKNSPMNQAFCNITVEIRRSFFCSSIYVCMYVNFIYSWLKKRKKKERNYIIY